MRHLHTAEQVRALEAPLLAALPEGTLMQRAAHGLARACAGMLPAVYGSRVLLLVGGGNNGADALWAGALLARRGAQVTAVLVGTPVASALAGFRAAGGRVVAAPGPADLAVDGLVGLGGRGPLRPEAAALVRQVRAPVVAVDVPSGVDADTGEVAGEAVTAALTVTFGVLKPGLLVARRHVGRRRARRHRPARDGHRPRRAGRRRRRRACCRGPSRRPTSTRAASSGWRPGRRPTRARPCSRSGRP